MIYPAVDKTNFKFPGQEKVYHGKVRDVYDLGNYLIFIVTDRISAFDNILPRPIPYKGEVLNLIAEKFLRETTDIVKNWLIEVPDPAVSLGYKCKPVPVEMVIRGHLCGHALREYKAGKTHISGVPFPGNMKPYEPFPKPIITPATKASEGHDEDISKEDIIKQGIVPENIYEQLEEFTLKLFKRGQETARERNLILADTKYEFGLKDGEIYLIDEIHTPDSSRYFYADGFFDKIEKGESPKQLSKEFVREWLMSKGFMGKAGQRLPEMDDLIVERIMKRYFELFEQLLGEKFSLSNRDDVLNRIETNVLKTINKL